MHLGRLVFSLQAKLIFAFVCVVLVALAFAGAVFVALRRGEQEEQALDHVVAKSPAVYSEFTNLQRRGDPVTVLSEFAQLAAEENDLRILLVDRTNGVIAQDTGGDMEEETLVLPQEFSLPAGRYQPYVSFRPEEGVPGADLILVTALPSRITDFRQVPPRGAEPYWPFFAVPESTIRGAWRELLPPLMLAAAIALPIAVVLATLVASYITRPLQQLTLASQRMAGGDYDVRVSVDRDDQVGRLARAFSIMAQRVGDAQAQMRALVANVSHDLKTPLTSILGFGQALRDGRASDPAEARRMGGVIYDEASRLSARLADLLLISELESGQAFLQRDEIDLGRLVESSVERVGQQLEERGVRVDTQLEEGVTVNADGAKLERAVENLLDNARKYTSSGGDLRVRAYADNGLACIEVANSAPDLTDEELPRLFERFYRRERSRGADVDGSGLGLPIARDLVELHGGRLDATLSGGELSLTIRLPAGS
jgi:signal transduction histidine kinase